MSAQRYRRFPFILLVLFGLFGVSSTTLATTAPVTGLFSGNGSRTLGGCLQPSLNGTAGAFASIILTRVSSSEIRGRGQIDTGVGIKPVDILGTVTNGNANLLLRTGPLIINATGTIANGTITLSITSATHPVCSSFTGRLVLRLNTVVPELSPGNLITTALNLGSRIRQLRHIQWSRVQSLFRGRGPGAMQIPRGFLLQSGPGQPAGDSAGYPFGIWGSYSRSSSKDDFVSTAFDADSDMILAGMDFRPVDAMVVGLAVGRETHAIDTDFNHGRQNISGHTVSPYVGLLLNDHLSMSLSAGRTEINIAQYRTDSTTQARISSALDSERWFWSGNLEANTSYDNWLLTGHFGILWMQERQEGFTESDGTTQIEQVFGINQWQLGGEVAYAWDEFEPFVSAIYARDYHRTELATAAGVPEPSSDDDDLQFTLGLRYFGYDGISASAEWSHVFAREDFTDDTLNLLLRADF